MDENSAARGAAFSVIKALRKQAQGCMSMISVGKLISATRFSQRSVFRALAELEEIEEIQRLQWLKDKRLRLYHLRKICAIENATSWQGLCPQLVELSAGYKITARPKNRNDQIPLFAKPVGNWVPIITDEELRWRSEQLKRLVGIPVRPEEPAGPLFRGGSR
jgi:hypothetical protein